MDADRRQRILKQHITTDRLLGVDAVPRAISDQTVTQAPPPPAVSSTPPDTLRYAPPESLLAIADAPKQTYAEPLPREQRLQILSDIDTHEVKPCTQCDLCQGRTQTVFGEGDPEAPVMFIGEGPGQQEDETGRPFVGRAGELLEKMINAMGFDRGDVYIANVV